MCVHGRPLACDTMHDKDDPLVGSALCADCYDYAGAVTWNALLPELWRRTILAARRNVDAMRPAGGRPATVAFVRVYELQRRGLAHLHCLLRLDGDDGGPPPAWATAGVLAQCVAEAVASTSAPHPAGYRVRWGTQLDVREVGADGQLDGLAAANYLAKYATKTADASGQLDHRLRFDAEIDTLDLSEHMKRMLHACFFLDRNPAYRNLRLKRWAHTLGVGSHFLTKSRRWSTTFGALRAARRAYAEDQARERHPGRLRWQPGVQRTAAYDYEGVGWGPDVAPIARRRAADRADASRLASEALSEHNRAAAPPTTREAS